MKYFLILLNIMLLLSLSAFAQVANTPPNPTASDVLLGLLGLVKSWGTLGIYAGIAAALKLLVDATKAFGIFDKIPAAFQSSFVILIGVLTVGLTTLAAGGTVSMALAAALGSSGAAMLLHEWLDDIVTWVKAKLNPPPKA